MDFRLTAEEEAFREEVQDFLQELLPPDWLGVELETWQTTERIELYQLGVKIRQELGAKGWLGMSWPKEYGGQAAPTMKEVILREEIYYRKVPGYDPQTFDVAGPLILHFGTDEQKVRFIPPITRGQAKWAIGMSEPGAGSDLAALQTRAVEEKDCFVLNGQKTWQSSLSLSDWQIVYARTDPNVPKHRGLSVFLVDLKSSGVTIRPIALMNGLTSYHNEAFYDNVRVPKENLLGRKNEGWSVASVSFALDRSCGLIHILYAKRNLELLIQYCKETHIGGQPLAKDPTIRNRLAGLAIEVEVGRNLGHRLDWMTSEGMPIGVEAALMRVYSGYVYQRLANLGMQILGLYGQLDEESKWVKLRGRMKDTYLSTPGMTIAAGTTEIAKNTVARIGLGLPKG
jgi:hypothetical protein